VTTTKVCGRAFATTVALILLSVGSLCGESSEAKKAYSPPELQLSDPDIKALQESASNAASEGRYSEAIGLLQKALLQCTNKGLTADRGIIEDTLASAYFSQGKLQDARDLWANALSDGIKSSNLGLQADALVAMAALAQATGNLTDAMDWASRAVEIARKGRSMYIGSRALGELGRLQLTLGKKSEARASVDAALQIDRANGYDWEPIHLLYSAWVTGADPDGNSEQAIEIATSARTLAIRKENYLVFLQASNSIGTAYVWSGRVSAGITVLEQAESGRSDDGKPLFQRQASYQAAVSLPFFRMALLESLAMAYQKGQRTDEAISTWSQLYDTAGTAGTFLFAAEAANSLADLYNSKKDYDKAISNYSRAADAWRSGGNQSRRISALLSQGSLLFANKRKGEALAVYETLLPLVRQAKDIRLQFLVNMSIAEALDGTQNTAGLDSALHDATQLVGSDLTIAGIEPSLLVELYIRLAASYQRRHDTQQELLALEKGVTPAVALATTPQEKKNDKPLAWLMAQLQAKISDYQLREIADQEYANGQLKEALLSLELLQYFAEFDAAWRGRYEEYNKSFTSDPVGSKLLQVPFKLINQQGGAEYLSDNLKEAGPIAGRVKLVTLVVLDNYYILQQRPDLVVNVVTEALPYLKLGSNDIPNAWDVTLACNYAFALMMQKDQTSAVKMLGPCMSSAKKLGDAGLLRLAHQTNVWIRQAAGSDDQLQESIQYLIQNSPDDPQEYVELAQLRSQQNDRSGAVEAWRKAVQLFEARNNMSGAGAAHVALAQSLTGMTAAESQEQLLHLEAAIRIFKQLGNKEGQVGAESHLGAYFALKKNSGEAQRHYEAALTIAREAGLKALEADVLSQIGRAHETAGDLTQSIEYYRGAADVYREIKDLANESFQLQNSARLLNALHHPDEAIKTLLRAEALADESKLWSAQYWARRRLSEVYANQGQYEDSLRVLEEAKRVADTADQPLSSAWAALSLAADLEVVGGWQDALDQINSAIPVLQRFKDIDDEANAYIELSAIYGSRESEVKDLDKALEFYQKAYQLVASIQPGRAALLTIDLVEIYWQMGRYADAVTKATEALDYYKTTNNEEGQALVLLGLADVQRSQGDIKGASRSLQLAEPMVMRANNFYTTGSFYYRQAGLLAKQGRFKDAIDQYQRVIALLEQVKESSGTSNRRRVSETYSFIYEELIDAYYWLGSADKQYTSSSAEQAFKYTELNKSRIFASSWGLALVDGLRSQVPAQLQEQERSIFSQRTSLQSELQDSLAGKGKRSAEEIERALDSVTEQQSELVRQLRKASPAYAGARYPQPVSVAELPMREGELLVEFKVLQNSVLVWMIGDSANGGHLVAFYKVDRPRGWFEKQVLSLRDAFNSGHPENFDPHVSEALFNALFPEPFAGQLTKSRSVVFVPDDILFLLPIEMLSPHAARGQFVLLNTPTEYFPSAAAFRLSRTVVRAGAGWREQFIGIGDPITSAEDERFLATTVLTKTRSGGPELATQGVRALRAVSVDKLRAAGLVLERLPGTATEVNNIAGLFSQSGATSEVRTGADATKEELMQTDLGRFRFVHFATHGVLPVDAAVKEPALVLSYRGGSKDDMLLTLSDVLQLKLSADVVVLSACNTGSGKVTRAEGVSSLGIAFLGAGASSTVVSLWQVSDASTSLFMQEFYKNLMNGKSKAASLSSARAVLVAQGFDNPFFWAPFVLTGE